MQNKRQRILNTSVGRLVQLNNIAVRVHVSAERRHDSIDTFVTSPREQRTFIVVVVISNETRQSVCHLDRGSQYRVSRLQLAQRHRRHNFGLRLAQHRLRLPHKCSLLCLLLNWVFCSTRCQLRVSSRVLSVVCLSIRSP